MPASRIHSRTSLTLAHLLFAPAVLALSLPAADKPRDEDEEIIVLSPFEVSPSFGATPGGAQDINYFRLGAGRGQIPHPDTLTAEGLFSEHDLPLELGTGGKTLFRVQSAAATARFEVLPEVRYLAQLGLSSGLKVDGWARAPLNLVAVIDKSGSMSGEPLALVRASLHNALGHLRDGDQISIILYGDRAHVHLAPTAISAASRAEVRAQIDRIESAGSTAMEAGLQLGYQVARESRAKFEGTTRVMLFTDERPNVGNTAAEGFMAMAREASREGVGLTTIGVGIQFGADLATRISSVRGGNLFFFEDGAQMTKTFADDFDMMVTELAHEFAVRLVPAAGFRIAGVFGVPADMLRWDGDALVLDVATIFLSKRKGAIFFALAPDSADRGLPGRAVSAGTTLATVDFSYRDARDDRRVTATAACRLLAPRDLPAGLARGAHLVDQYLTFKHAARLHLLENDQESAYQLMHGLLARLEAGAATDAALAPERDLVREVHNTLALLSGHTGEIAADAAGSGASPLLGVWRRAQDESARDQDEFLVVWPNGVIEPMLVDRATRYVQQLVPLTVAGELPDAARGKLARAGDEAEAGADIHFEITGDRLTLRVPADGEGDENQVYTRASFSDLPRGENHEEVQIDELSGLPVSRVTPPRSQRSRRLGWN